MGGQVHGMSDQCIAGDIEKKGSCRIKLFMTWKTTQRWIHSPPFAMSPFLTCFYIPIPGISSVCTLFGTSRPRLYPLAWHNNRATRGSQSCLRAAQSLNSCRLCRSRSPTEALYCVVFCVIPQVRIATPRWSIFLPLCSVHREVHRCVDIQIR